MRSAPSVRAWKGTFRKPCTASVWKMALGHLRWVTRAISAMGSTAPTSLLTIMQLTSTVSGRRAAARSSAVMRPWRSGFR